jgi:hypothetical protein
MMFPARIPGLRLATVLLVVFALVWIGLEGDVRRVTILGIWMTAVGMLTLLQQWLGGRSLSIASWLGVSIASGLVLGAASVLLTLFLMALKTGLHGHGPEFTPGEIADLWSRLPLWTVAGALLGLGVGLIAAALTRLRSARTPGDAG